MRTVLLKEKVARAARKDRWRQVSLHYASVIESIRSRRDR